MSREEKPNFPLKGSEITTACGGIEQFSAETPRVLYKAEWIFFCTPACQEEFIQNPDASCLTSHTAAED